MRGIVTADFQAGTGGPNAPRGFFLQAHESDCDDATSDGVFVYTGSAPRSVRVGDLVKVAAASVTEYAGPASFTWDLTLTELVCSSSCTVSTLATDQTLPTPEDLSPPADATQAVVYLEAREGMLAQLATDATVVAPTNAHHELVVVRGAAADRLHQEASNGGLGIAVDGDGVSASKCGTEGLPAARTFDVIRYRPAASQGVYGPLTYNFNAYKVQQDDDARCAKVETGDASSYEPTTNGAPSRASDTLTVGDLNAENFFDTTNDAAKGDPIPTTSEYNTKSLKLARAICSPSGLNEPHIVALQEVEGQSVLDKLTADVAAVCGANYDAHTRGAPDDRSIEVAYLTRADSVTVLSVTLKQGCTAVDHRVDYESGDAPPDVTCADPTPFYLHSRPPLELVAKVTLAGADRTVTLYNNHFKSKLSSASCSDRDCTDWRVEEAQHVRALVNELPAGSHAIVLGDLNDLFESATLDELVRPVGPLTSLWDDHPAQGSGQGSVKRYGYVHMGVSQVLDHVLVSESLNATQRVLTPRHFDADWPASLEHDDSTHYRVSDHDGLVAAFTFATPERPPEAAFAYACEALACRFDASESTDPEGRALTYAWDFGDGTSGAGVQVDHSYAEQGRYNVSLSVTDAGGLSDAETQTVTVAEKSCGAIVDLIRELVLRRLPVELPAWLMPCPGP